MKSFIAGRFGSIVSKALLEVIQKVTRLENEDMFDSSQEGMLFFHCTMHYCASI